MTPTTEHFTSLELLLIKRLKQLRSAAAEFLDAEADHGGFFHPEKLTRKREARRALENEVDCLSVNCDELGRKLVGQAAMSGSAIAWLNAGPAA